MQEQTRIRLLCLFLLVIVALSNSSAASECSVASTCRSCSALSGCGWCSATNSCLSGNETGPYQDPDCDCWSYGGCPDDCSNLTNCSSCLAIGGCNWCGASQTCIFGGPAGACPTADCDGCLKTNVTQCPTQNCSTITNCYDCTNAQCGWCPTGGGVCLEFFADPNTGVNLQCINSPLCATDCQLKTTNDSCPISDCRVHTSCLDCLLEDNCAWNSRSGNCYESANGGYEVCGLYDDVCLKLDPSQCPQDQNGQQIDCHQFDGDCASCSATQGCGYCFDNDTCHEISSSIDPAYMCDLNATYSYMCYQFHKDCDSVCSSRPQYGGACSSCVTSPASKKVPCGWCIGGPMSWEIPQPTMLCVAAKEDLSGPLDPQQSCLQFHTYNGSSEIDPSCTNLTCTSLYTCKSCIANPNCGWCGVYGCVNGNASMAFDQFHCNSATGLYQYDSCAVECPVGPNGKICSGHGTCNSTSGQCTCAGAWQGPSCSCSTSGTSATCNSTFGQCNANQGYCYCANAVGDKCDIPCNCIGSYGTCNPQTGACECTSNLFYGSNCNWYCTPAFCNYRGTCGNKTVCRDGFCENACDCEPPWSGPRCDVYCDFQANCSGHAEYCFRYEGNDYCNCSENYFLPNCSLYCNDNETCNGNGVCDELTGLPCHCNPGFFGPICNITTNDLCFVDSMDCNACQQNNNSCKYCKTNHLCIPESAPCAQVETQCVSNCSSYTSCSSCTQDPNCLYCESANHCQRWNETCDVGLYDCMQSCTTLTPQLCVNGSFCDCTLCDSTRCLYRKGPHGDPPNQQCTSTERKCHPLAIGTWVASIILGAATLVGLVALLFYLCCTTFPIRKNRGS